MSFVKLTLNPKDGKHLLVLPHLLPAVVQAAWFSPEEFQFGFSDTWRVSTICLLLSRDPREVSCWTVTTWLLIVVPFPWEK